VAGLAAVCEGDEAVATWSFLTNHALVLTVINRKPDSTGLEIAQAVGITERAARRIIADLQEAGYIESERIGRRNQYRIDVHRALGRFGERELTVGEFLVLLQEGAR
jgi:DNA-binding IclR family transcriptional regulator